MSLFVGDNFKYGGRKFLDDRESFDTLEAMKNYNKVPDGFITYCKENGKRYEFNSSNIIDELTGQWTEFSVNLDIDTDEIYYIGTETPEDESDIWFDPGTQESSSNITIDNPLIAELFSCIAMMQKQIFELQEEVEYLKLYGGNGGSTKPEKPDSDSTDLFFLLEDGSYFELEDGGFLIMEEERPVTSKSAIMLEDGASFLLEDGGLLILE